MLLKDINKIDPECYLKYAMYILGQRHADLVAWGKVHKGPANCEQQYAAAHYQLNQAASSALSDIAIENNINLWSYSREQKGKPNTRSFISCFMEQGIEFKDRKWNDRTDFQYIMSIPENMAKLDAFHTIFQVAQIAGWKGNKPEELISFLCDKLGVEE